MQQKMKGVVGSWNKELLVLLVAVGVLAAAPSAFASQCVPGTNYHYHSGGDHCDTGSSGCEVVCVGG